MNFLLKKCIVFFSKSNFRTLSVLAISFFFLEACNIQVSLNKNLNPDLLTNLIPTPTPTSTPSPTPTPTQTVYPGTLHEISFQTSKGRDEVRSPTVFGDAVYFTSMTPIGAKIFRVKNNIVTQISDTNPGGDDNPENLTAIGTNLYFSAFNGTGYKAFRYDGTSVTQFSDTNPSGSDYPQEFTSFKGKIFFIAKDYKSIQKLYVTEGITSEIALHTSLEQKSDNCWGLRTVGSNLYFVSSDQTDHQKLFQYDGSSVTQISNLNPGDHDYISNLTAGDDKLYFVSNNADGLYKIFSFDGTNLSQLPDTFNSSQSDQPHDLAFNNGKLYFGARNQDGNDKLFVYENGVSNKISNTGINDYPANITFMGDRVFFRAYNSFGYHVYEYDGNGVVSQPIFSLNLMYEESPSALTVEGNNLYFSLWNSNNQRRLFKYDLVNATEIPEIMGNTQADIPTNMDYFVAFGGKVYFTASNYEKSKFYSTDGITTKEVSSTNNTYNYSPDSLIAFQDRIYFSGLTPDGFTKVFATDGNTVTQISNLNPNNSDNPNSFILFNNKLFFSALNFLSQSKLFVFDGSNLTQISNTSPSGSDDPNGFFIYDSKLCFSARNSSNFTKIFCYDGNIVSQLPDVNGGDDNPGNFIVNGSKFYFTADSTGSQKYKVYQYDGTSITKLGDTIEDPMQSDDPSYLTIFKNELYFVSRDSGSYRKIFKFDGTNLSKVAEINSGTTDEPNQLIANDSYLYFAANNGATLQKLFAFDGVSVAQISNTAGMFVNDTPQYLTMIDNKLYVNLNVDESGNNNWSKLFLYEGIMPSQISDTNKDGLGGYFGDEPYYVTKLDDKIFYSAFWKTKIQKLYIYANGVESLATAISPGMEEEISNLVPLNGSLYFSANFGGDYEPMRRVYKYTP